jgi:type I restriction enzyme S subunit
MSELPEQWEWATIGDVADIAGGVQKSPKRRPVVNAFPMLRVANVLTGRLDLAELHEIELFEGELARLRLKPGDCLVVEGNGSIAQVGRAAMWRGEVEDCVHQNHILRARPLIHPPFLVYWLQSPAARGAIESAASSTSGLNVLSGAKLRRLPIPVPPRAEQERIVVGIEEHLSRLDAADAALLSSERRLRSLEKSIITECSSTLAPLPHWRIVAVADAGVVGLGLQRSPKRHAGRHMRPYLRVANVFEDRIDDNDVMSMDMTEAEWGRFRLRDGDVLLNEGQSPEFLGRPAIYRGDPPAVAFTNSLIRFRANADVDPEWALLVFRSHMHNRRFMRESQITTNIAHLAAGRFKTVEFPLPPLDEQQSRVADARARLEGCARLRREIATSKKRSRVLRRAVFAAAFRGSLVPQDPNDEPAAMLLKLIGACRPDAAPAMRKSGLS